MFKLLLKGFINGIVKMRDNGHFFVKKLFSLE